MISNGYEVNESDKYVYYKYENHICTIICLYVEDLHIFGSNIQTIYDVKSLLCKIFLMKNLGEVSVINITRSEQGISLDQSHYMEMILKKYNYFYCKPASTQYVPIMKLFKNIGESVRQTKFVSIIDNLKYATDCTRPNIVYVVGLLCRFTSRSSNEHCKVIEWVMWYLKKTVNLKLHYQRFYIILEGYNDVYWNTLSDDSKETSGYIFNIVGGVVS